MLWGFRRFLTLLSSSSHMCSIGVKSGLYGGHASCAMLLFVRKSWQTRATCGQALSYCRIRLRCCTSGTTIGRKISSLYLTAVILPRLFPMRQWRRVVFTDESRFTLYRTDGRRHVYRPRRERFADACVVERDRFGGGSVMVWGGIAHGIKSQLIIVAGNMTAVRYRDEILRPVVVPLVNGITSWCELSMLWLTLSKGELGQQRQQEGGTPDIDFQFDFDFKIWRVATNELQ